MTRERLAATLICLLIAGCNDRAPTTRPASPDEQPQDLPTTRLTLAGKSFTLQIADEEKEHQKGLMFRKDMPRDHGMIFVFPAPSPRGFWMKNTPIDLDILYIDRTGRIVSIKTMYAYSTRSTPSDGDAMYAIELNAGVAKELGLSAGQVLDIPSGLKAQD